MIFFVIVLIVWCVGLTIVNVLQQRIISRTRFALSMKPWINSPQPNVVDPQDRFRCGCDHHFAFHDRSTGRCRHVSRLTTWDGHSRQHVHTGKIRCSCQGYTGPLPSSPRDNVGETIRLVDGTELTFSPFASTGTEIVTWTSEPSS